MNKLSSVNEKVIINKITPYKPFRVGEEVTLSPKSLLRHYIEGYYKESHSKVIIEEVHVYDDEDYDYIVRPKGAEHPGSRFSAFHYDFRTQQPLIESRYFAPVGEIKPGVSVIIMGDGSRRVIKESFGDKILFDDGSAVRANVLAQILRNPDDNYKILYFLRGN